MNPFPTRKLSQIDLICSQFLWIKKLFNMTLNISEMILSNMHKYVLYKQTTLKCFVFHLTQNRISQHKYLMTSWNHSNTDRRTNTHPWALSISSSWIWLIYSTCQLVRSFLVRYQVSLYKINNLKTDLSKVKLATIIEEGNPKAPLFQLLIHRG